MEAKFPTLRRPKRKLCYITEKKSLLNRWEEPFTYEDVDKMFDDIDVCVPESNLPPALLLSSDSASNHSKASISPVPQEMLLVKELPEHQIASCSPVPGGDVHLPIQTSPVNKLDMDLGTPFKAHGPIKTSSPIGDDASEKTTEKLNEEEEECHGVILFNCEDKAEEPQKDAVATQKPQCAGQVSKGSDSEEESPPSRFALNRVSGHKPVIKIQGRNENIKESVGEVRIEPEVASSMRVSTEPPAEQSSHVGKDITGFLKKLQLARISKPSCSQKSPIKAQPLIPPPPPEDDFLILEDDAPLCFSIPHKSTLTKKQKHNKSSSTEKERSTDKETKDGPTEVPHKQKEAKMTISNTDSLAVNQKPKKKKKGKEKTADVVESDNHKGDLLGHQDLPAGDLTEQENPKKKKQHKKVSQSDKLEDQEKDKTSEEPEKEEPAQKTEKKEKSTKMKNVKGGNEMPAKGGTKSLKGRRKQPKESEPVKEMEHIDDAFRDQTQETADTEDPIDFTADKGIMSKADGKAKQDKKSATPTSSSTEDAQLLRKRKKKQPGEWWVSCPQSPEKTETSQPLKKPKQNRKEPSTDGSSSLKSREVLREKPKEPTKLPSNHNNKNKEGKRKETKRRNVRAEKISKVAEKVVTAEAELEEQQIPDQDLAQEPSPLVFSKRDLSLNSRGELFQKVYHHTPHEKKSSTSTTPRSQPGQPKTQLGETEQTRRRRKPPGDWWAVPTEADDVEIFASQPPLKEPKHQKERKKQTKLTPSRLVVPEKGNVASSTPGGAPVTSVRQLFPPKTVRPSLAKFKDIFSSVVETPTAATNRDTHQCKKQNVTSQPMEERPDTGPIICSRPDADESTQSHQEIPQEGPCQTEDVVSDLRSGPSSMIELENYDADDMNLPSSRVQTVLSMSDFCAYPLKSFTLHAKDKENLAKWLQSLCSTGADSGATITPDQFQWFFYQDRALGVQVDINSSSICSGKLLMGSYMKKPLWVDHSATTIFNLLTSSVSVKVNGSVSHYSSGQAFMVECGQAYSIQNSNAQPAVLYFTRILAESSD